MDGGWQGTSTIYGAESYPSQGADATPSSTPLETVDAAGKDSVTLHMVDVSFIQKEMQAANQSPAPQRYPPRQQSAPGRGRGFQADNVMTSHPGPPTAAPAAARTGAGGPPWDKGVCHNCGREGHWAHD